MLPVDSCWHKVPNKHALEWWYFTLLCDGGDVLRGRLWVRGDHQDASSCGIELHGYPATGEPWELIHDYDRDSFYAERSRELVMVGASSFEHREEAYYLSVRRGDFVLNVEAVPLLRWDEPIRYHLNRTHGFLWTVPMLKGRFAGTIQQGTASPERPLAGFMFHDHVLSDYVPSLDLFRNYRGWCWGLCYLEDWTALFLAVDFKRDPIRLALVADGQGISARRNPSTMPIQWTGLNPPRFTIARGSRTQEVHLSRVYRKQRGGVGRRWREPDRVRRK
ncbi:hypothetical protein ACFL59_12675, partial [Planctomycetota bacterium]